MLKKLNVKIKQMNGKSIFKIMLIWNQFALNVINNYNRNNNI